MAGSNVGLIRDFFNQVGLKNISEKDAEIGIQAALINDGDVDKDERALFLKVAGKVFPKLEVEVLNKNQFTTPLDRLKGKSDKPSDQSHAFLLARLIVARMKNADDADQLIKFVSEYPEISKSVLNHLKQKGFDSTYFTQYIKILLIYTETLQPETRAEGTTFTIEGTTFANPNGWLAGKSGEIRRWVEQQSRATKTFLNNIPGYADVEAFVRKNYKSSTFPTPQVSKGYVYYLESGSKQDESPILYRKKIDSDDPPQIAFKLSEAENKEHSILARFIFSPDGNKLMAIISKGGRDYRTLKIFNPDDLEKPIDEVSDVTNTSIAWKPDGTGFYYSIYQNASGKKGPDAQGDLYHKVYFHSFNTPVTQDNLIYENKNPKDQTGMYLLDITNDGKGLLLIVSETQEKQAGIYYRPIQGKGEFELLFKTDPIETYNIIGTNNLGELILYTTDKAPNGKVVAVDPKNPKNPWRTIIPEKAEVIASAVTAGGKIIVHYMENIFSRVKVYNPNGTFERDILLPPHVCVMDRSDFNYFQGEPNQTKVVALISNPIMPPQLVVADITTGKTTPLLKPEAVNNDANSFNFSDYQVELLKIKRPDKTEVTGTFIHSKDATPDDKMTILIDGYLGFNRPYTPWFENKYLPILKAKGGILIVHGRAGGEFGQKEYLEGIKEKGNNPMLDVIIMAQGLVDLHWTSAGKIVVNGRSHGGLVMGSAALQKQELLKYAIPAVADLNILHSLSFLNHTNTQFWMDKQYGDPRKDPKVLKAMAAYSPTQLALTVDQTLLGQQVFLLPASQNDDRVPPGEEIYPFVAAVQQRKGHALLRVYENAGHGDNSNESNIQNIAEDTAFYLAMMGINPKNVFKKSK